jgi:hypothetical protein
MTDQHDPHTDAGQPPVYRIRVQGELGPQWTAWFEGLTVTPTADGETCLTGPVMDQAALYGLLRKVRDLGLPLLAVECLVPGQVAPPDLDAGA